MAAKGKKPNWIKIRAEYEAGGTSYRKLAAKHGVPQSTLEQRAKRESWTKTKAELQGKVAAEVRQKLVESISVEMTEVVERHYGLWDRMIQKAEAMLDQVTYVRENPKDPNSKMVPVACVADARDLKEWATAVKTATEGQRLALGVDKASVGGAPDDDDFSGALWD